MSEITIPKPDDWHLHLRDGAMMKGVLPHSARDFARAIIMPNLVPPVVTGADAEAYRDRIMAALPDGMSFKPLMTLYLTEGTDAADVAGAHASGLVTAVATPAYLGRTQVTYEIVVSDERGKRVCTCRITCALIPKEKVGL